jgi:hypothetical protein
MRGCRGYTHVPGATCLARDRHNCNAAIILTRMNSYYFKGSKDILNSNENDKY